ncbi:MAG: DinB family protein [Nakamurella sp.]
MNWTRQLDLQLSWHWENHLRRRWDGLSDLEYFWEPAPGMWSVRQRGQGVAIEVGAGDHIIDFAFPEPSPPPLTTIAWRMGHLLVGVFGSRLASHFGGPAVDYDSYEYPSTAADALDRLDAMYAAWVAGVRSLDEQGLQEPCGESGFEQDPMAALILHIHREVIHHGAEISLLRDLYAWQ